MRKKDIIIIALSPVGNGLSGGDRIFIEFAKNLSKNVAVKIVTWNDGEHMARREGLDKYPVKLESLYIPLWISKNFVICYLYRIFIGMLWSIKEKSISSQTIVYSGSEFWMDVIPAGILRAKKKCKWVAAWYQTAPNPLKGYTEGPKRKNTYKLQAVVYWLSQAPVKPFIHHFADFVLVNNRDEKKQFPNLTKKNKTIVLLGAVDTERIAKWQMENTHTEKTYDAVFQGRFHPQKGVMELIDIWNIVVKQRPRATLILIGDGPLMSPVITKIKELHLTKNIIVKGYVFDGDQKYRIFSKSKVVVHPALYDSGGMAAAEAMIFGLPCIGFNLKAYDSYYPQGMIKVTVGDIYEFADTILDILNDESKRKTIGAQARMTIQGSWSWTSRIEAVFQKIL